MLSNWLRYGFAATCATAALIGFGVTARGGVGEDPRADFVRPASQRSPIDLFWRDVLWALGRKLFFDPRLSASATLSCASCHQPGHGWNDALPRAIGDAHRPLAFRAPTLLNAGMIERFGWTGRFTDVEQVIFFAMSSPKNMNLPVPEMLARLENDPHYVASFRAAFPDAAISKHNVGAALDHFVRSITSDVAPFDRWAKGDEMAISTNAVRGFAIFTGKGRCAECHRGWAFTDGSFHDIGIGRGKDVGRGSIFKSSVKLQYAFKTPTLRDVAVRSPYMHDGSLATLRDVVQQYDKGGIDRPSRATAIGPLGLSIQDKEDLVAFLETLTGGTKFVVEQSGE